MKRNALLLALALVASVALAQTLDTSVRTEFTDCASGGSAAQSLTSGERYVMRVTGEDTFVCFASSGSTCATGGEKWPAGTVIAFTINGNQVSASCRSTASTGDVIFTKFK